MNNWLKHLFTALAIILTVLVYYLWLNLENRWFLLVSGAVYLFLISVLYYYQKGLDTRKGIGLLILSMVASLSFLSVVENTIVQIVLLVLGMVIMTHFFFYPGEELLSPPQKKPWRRWRSFIITWDFLAVVILIFALNAFLPEFPFWLLALLASALGVYLTVLLWQEYFPWERKKFFLWAVVLFLLLWEVLWVIHFLPLGYLVLGVLVVWPWYLAQILVRFHLSSEGVAWRRQLTFLVTNLILYILILLFFVKWI